MKRIILTSLCAVFALGLYAQKEKAVFVHKTDGTTVEYIVGGIRNFSFRGKAVVNDDDYTQITDLALTLEDTEINIDIAAAFNADDPYIAGGRYGTDWGILYSTSPGVTVENGTLVEGDGIFYESPRINSEYSDGYISNYRIGESVTISEGENGAGRYVDLEYNTTYYFRTFVYRPENSGVCDEAYFYSKEKSVSVGKPSMAYYGVENIPANLSKSGYVMPTEEAWAAFDEQYPYFALSSRKSKEVILNHWNEYLTSERVNILKTQCNTVYDCAEGKLYVAEQVNEDFLHYVLSHYEGVSVLSGYSEILNESSNTIGTYIECDAEWNVPGNGYWKYTADTRKNPWVEIPLTKWMLANYLYKIEITLAPNTVPEETLPSKVSVDIYYKAGGGDDLATKYETNVNECSVITADSVAVNAFTEATIRIASVMDTSLRGQDKNKFLPILRVAQIKVTPYRKENVAGE